MQIVNIIGAKGGVGASTTAALIATHMAAAGNRVVVVDATGTGDIVQIIGYHDDTITVKTQIPTGDEADDCDVVIVDHCLQATPSHGTNVR